MYSLIRSYEQSCNMVKKRIKLLTQQRNQLVKSGKKQLADSLNLEQRIRLLYIEAEQMQEIVEHLKNYERRVSKRAKA